MSDTGHTSLAFERELRALRDQLLLMAGRAEEQLERALQALLRQDEALVGRVLADDQSIDADQLAIDEMALVILARRQPVASDLRFVALALKMVTDIERIGDLAVNIAKRARELHRFGPLVAAPLLEELGRSVRAALRSAFDALARNDAALAERVIADDTNIDRLNTQLIAEILDAAASQHTELSRSLALSSVSRYLERVGDHATNIAELVIYFVRGRDVRRGRPSR